MILTFRYRLRDKHATELNRQARAVNIVWNYCNEMQRKAVAWDRKWLHAYDLQKLTAGSSKLLDIHGHTIQKVCLQYDTSRRQHNRPWLRFRSVKSLGWVPFNTGTVTLKDDCFVFRGKSYEPMHFREIPANAKIRSGAFGRDSSGKWYVNCCIEVDATIKSPPSGIIGIDLGLKDLATLSNGEKIENKRIYYKHESAFMVAQKARKRNRMRAIGAKIANTRRDYLHKCSSSIAKNHGFIVIGSLDGMAESNMAKSIRDAGWSIFREQLSYKAIRHGGILLEVSEAYTTQTCSNCGALPDSRPRGIAGLGIREWTCECGITHDRDVNAAKNILAAGYRRLAAGIQDVTVDIKSRW